MPSRVVLLFVCVFAAGPVASAAVINVPADQPTILAAVTAAASGDEIVLADGIYTGAGNREVGITGKAITIRSASGDPTLCAIDAQNAGRAFTVSSVTTGAVVIRGLAVRNGIGTNGRGGGVFAQNANVEIRDCTFESCDTTTGGGAVFATQRSLLVEGCVFDTNSASLFGGAIETFNAITVNVSRCEFRNNSASVGGGIEFGQGTTATVSSSLFVGNTASGSRFGFAGYGGGGVVVVNGASATITGSTFVGNTTDHIAANDGGGGVYALSSTCAVQNSIFWENADLSGMTQNGQLKGSGAVLTLNRSLVQALNGSLGGVGNLGDDPRFADAPMMDFRLGSLSPAVDAGDNALIAAGNTTDLDGNARRTDAVHYADTGAGAAPVVDMGAYEAPADLPGDCPADLSGDGVVNGTDLATLLAAWGGAGPADLDGSGAVGGADLAVLLAAWGPCD